MKKFYDIKKKSHKAKYKGLGLKKLSKPNYFWDDDNFRIIAKRDSKKVNPRLKQALGKILLILLILIIFVTFVLARGYKAYADMEKSSGNAKIHLTNTFNALNNNNIDEAMSEAAKASDNVKSIRLNLQSWGQDSNYFNISGFKKSKLTNLEILLKSADLALGTINDTRNEIGSMTKEGITFSDPNNPADSQIKIFFDKNKLNQFFGKADKNLTKSEGYLSDVDFVPFAGFDINLAKSGIEKLRSSLSLTNQILANDLPWLTTESDSRDILILFLNNNELRGGGGFIGSFAVAHFSDGTLNKLDFQTNIYKLDNQFSKNKQISPPEGLDQIADGKWAMRDSNWAVDFPESAAKIKQFYKLETGKEVSGVIALDTTLFEQLLKFTAPIEMPEYGLTIDSDNFAKEVQYEVEKGYFERDGNTIQNEPKKILADMMPKFLNNFFSSFSDQQKIISLTQVLSKALREKHLVFQFDNADFQNRLAELNYNGQVSQSDGDYLLVTNSNVGGMKSSLKMSEGIKYSVNIDQSGSISSDLKINRKHNGSNEWPDGTNKNYVRVLIPLGSVVKSFQPGAGNFWPLADQTKALPSLFEPGTEANRAKISFWMTTEPGQKSDTDLSYSQSNKIDTGGESFYYNLCVQKQVNSPIDEFELNISYPKNFKPVNVTNYDQKNRIIVIKDKLDQDKYYKIKFSKI